VQLAFQLFQTVYWIGLASWFGGAVFIAVVAPLIFRTIREHDPTLPTVLSVNLDAQHSTLLASTIVGKMMQTLTRASIVFAVAIVVGLIGQAVILKPFGASLVQLVIRASLFAFAAGALFYDWKWLSPRLFAQRQHFIDNADNPDVANPAKEAFERLSRESVNVLFLQTLLLLGLILFSANVAFVPPLSL
jgi:hypothetical protein